MLWDWWYSYLCLRDKIKKNKKEEKNNEENKWGAEALQCGNCRILTSQGII